MSEQTLSLPGPFGLLGRLKRDKSQFIKLIILALPMAAQNLVQTLLNFIDILMIGQLGETAIAAVALSNQIFFLLILLVFGISSGSAVFTAQFWGKKDIRGIHRTLGLGAILSLAGGMVFTMAALVFPGVILGIFTKDSAVISAGIPYLQTVSISYLFTAATFLYSSVLRSTGEVKLPLIISVTALSLNAFFNYALIFGRFGMPQLGIRGAALATAGARILETIALLGIIYGKRHPIAARLSGLLDQNKPFTKKFFFKVSPVILNEIGWSLGMTMFTLIYARMGTNVLAAYNIMETFSRLSFVFFQGTGFATAIVLGNLIGEGHQDTARRMGKTILQTIPFLGGLAGLMIFATAPLIPGFFNISETVATTIIAMLRIFALVMFIKISNMHIIIGLLRSGGDTHFSATIELIPMWALSIPTAALAGLVLHLSPQAVYCVCLSEEIVKYCAGLFRIKSGKWIHDLT